MPTAIVTGAAIRIGKAMALHLAAKGFNIALHYNRSEPSTVIEDCLLYTSPSPRDGLLSRMPSSA